MVTRKPRGTTAANADGDTDDVVLKLGSEELVVRHRYETLSIINDILIAIWFLVGSVCFLYPSLKEVGAWIFIVGSGQFMVRPALRLAHRFQLQRFPSSRWDL